ENVELFSSMGKNIVLGTTGWYDKKDEIEKIVKKQGNGLIWGSNFSIGMQMLFRIVRKAAALMDKVDGYDIMLHEMHHMRKKDSPSGSGISLANIILDEVSRKKGIFSETAHEQINPNKLHLSSTRGGEIHGTHTVYLDSLSDTIELTHRAKNRSGFAKGALTAARWIKGKTGFYKFDDILDELWQS
ncbi:MAG: 4-hydroxy-tetrahydrodipicolinate reductase, partial [Candidatus Kapaibacterium sp.]